MKILFLNKRPLYPTDTGGKIRTLNILRHLAEWHDVTYLCNLLPSERAAVDPMRQLGIRLETVPWRETPRGCCRFYAQLATNLCSKYPYNVNKDHDSRLHRRAKSLMVEEDYDLVICDFVQMSRNAMGLPATPSVLFEHNVEAEIFERHAKNPDANVLHRQYMSHQWRKMQRFEGSVGKQFDRVIAVSSRDKEKFTLDYGWHHVDVIDTAVDIDYFRPRHATQAHQRIVFVGSFDWLPNQDGAKYFVNHIWPCVKQKVPNAAFQLVGRNPPKEVQDLARTPGVEVVGTVPDVRPYIAEATVVVVPLRIAGGTRIKIFEAMAMERAVVSTSIGAEGLPVVDNENILLADGSNHMARAIVNLLNSESMRRRISEAGGKFVRQHYSSTTVARQFDAICKRAVASRRPSRTRPQPKTSRLGIHD